MITFLTSSFPLKRKTIWFAEKPSLKMGLFDNYIQSFYNKPTFGFKHFPKYTKIIDISNDAYVHGFCKQTLKKIRKAEELGIVCKTLDDNRGFVDMYNEFSVNKNFNKRLQEQDLHIFGDCHVTRAACTSDGRYLVYHTYLKDAQLKRVRLFYSVSIIHGQVTQEEKNLAGFANRYLHYQDMLYFKEQQFTTYDFGGYAYQTSDTSLMGINEFKDSFGGDLIAESNYESLICYFFKKIGTASFIKKWTR